MNCTQKFRELSQLLPRIFVMQVISLLLDFMGSNRITFLLEKY